MRVLRVRRSGSRSDSGQALVEFALVVPILMFLFFSIYEIGHYYSVRLSLRHGVREAARFAVTGNVLPDSTGHAMSRKASIERVIQKSAPQLAIGPEHIMLDPEDGGGPGEVVEVSVLYEYRFTLPGVSAFFPGRRLPLRVTAVMKNENF